MIRAHSFRLTLERESIALITLDDPATLNALTFALYAELADVFRALADETEVGAVVLTGAGGAFSSGGHVDEIIGRLVRAGEEELRAFNRLTADAVRAIRGLGKPVIAAIDGVAVGGGAALALAADVRFASPEARIGFVFPQVGLSAADMGTTWLLPRLVGWGRATELLLTGDIIGAAAAAAMGLVGRVVPSGAQLVPDALAYAERLAAGPRFATAATKQALVASAGLGFEDALEMEVELQTRCMQHEDFAAAYARLSARRAGSR